MYDDQRGSFIVLTGGENRATGENEANMHFGLITDFSVPAANMIVESRCSSSANGCIPGVP
jgi:hypothetical protein